MKTWIYSWIIYPALYSLAAILGFAKPKIRDTLRLRSWKEFLSLRFNVGQPIEYWIHVASHGELEYAIPILQELGRRGKRILVTYYSISARGPVEQLTQNFPNVSLVVPLPHDGLGLMREFVSLVRRQGVYRLLLLKYELWPGLLWECNAQGIKVVLVDALKPSWFHRQLLHKLDGILSGYASEIQSVLHKNIRVVGDTRVERVLERVAQSEWRLESVVSSAVRSVLATRPTLICGSMWSTDSKLLCASLKLFAARGGQLCNIVWVPHELDDAEARRVSLSLSEIGYQVLRIEEADKQLATLSQGPVVLVVLKKGILAELYRLGQAAFVGGGFGSGVHSVWEPAICGARVACGPRTRRSPESAELAVRGRLVRVSNERELCDWFNVNLKENTSPRAQAQMESQTESQTESQMESMRELLGQHIGAAQRIIQVCEEM